MRLIAALFIACLAAPALAQTKPAEKPAAKPAAKPATPAAAAKPAPAKTGYEAMPVAERIAIQSDLVWTGDLNSTANGEWGPLSLSAVGKTSLMINLRLALLVFMICAGYSPEKESKVKS